MYLITLKHFLLPQMCLCLSLCCPGWICIYSCQLKFCLNTLLRSQYASNTPGGTVQGSSCVKNEKRELASASSHVASCYIKWALFSDQSYRNCLMQSPNSTMEMVLNVRQHDKHFIRSKLKPWMPGHIRKWQSNVLFHILTKQARKGCN